MQDSAGRERASKVVANIESGDKGHESRNFCHWFRGRFKGGGGGGGGTEGAFFAIACFLKSLWRTKTVLFEVKLIINNAPLTYVYCSLTSLVYPNPIETCLTPNHLLFGRQWLYSSNTTYTDKMNRISKHFWDRWRDE